MKCPICELDLLMAEIQGIGVDYCPKCRGVWLDKSKFENLINRSTQNIEYGRNNQRNDKSYHGDDHEYEYDEKHGYDDDDHKYDKRGRKKRGFMDLLDF